jgi:hypothetical protein
VSNVFFFLCRPGRAGATGRRKVPDRKTSRHPPSSPSTRAEQRESKVCRPRDLYNIDTQSSYYIRPARHRLYNTSVYKRYKMLFDGYVHHLDNHAIHINSNQENIVFRLLLLLLLCICFNRRVACVLKRSFYGASMKCCPVSSTS